MQAVRGIVLVSPPRNAVRSQGARLIACDIIFESGSGYSVIRVVVGKIRNTIHRDRASISRHAILHDIRSVTIAIISVGLVPQIARRPAFGFCHTPKSIELVLAVLVVIEIIDDLCKMDIFSGTETSELVIFDLLAELFSVASKAVRSHLVLVIGQPFLNCFFFGNLFA